jgi:hypothetical protein
MKTNVRTNLIGLIAGAGYLLCASSPSRAQDPAPKRIAPDETLSYTNHPNRVIVTGKVVEVFETDKAVHLNFGKPRPDQTFTVLVYAYAAPSFPGLKEMKGKTIEATGFISPYEGKPFMYLKEPKDLKTVTEKP